MVIEVARTRVLQKPWGVTDPRPWNAADPSGHSIGEICFERSSVPASEPTLLLKILLTNQPLSIQVHPDDKFARSIGLPNGKTEAWYVLAAEPGAAVALGLKQSLTPSELRKAVEDGTIARLVAWRPISTDDIVFVPAGTIHAIGPGLVIAEIQQRSDATFRMFDHGRDRELHVERALAAAIAVPASAQTPPQHLEHGRVLLTSNSHFVFERLELEPDSVWHLDATRETWILILSGTARVGALNVIKGQAVFAEAMRVGLWAGETGVVCLIAYTGRGGPNPQLLQRTGDQRVKASPRRPELEPGTPSIGARQ